MKKSVSRQHSMKAMSFEKNGPKQGKRKSCRGISLSFLRLCAFFLTCVMIPALMVMPAEARTKPGYGNQGSSQSGQSGLPGKDKPGALNGETILENLLTSHSDASDSDTKESTVAEIDTFPENPCITWFVRGIEGRVKSAEVYIGAEQAEVSEAGRLIDGEGLAPKTLILVDNSESIGTRPNQEKIKAILTRLIWNHQYDERFAIKTFADKSVTIMDYTDNYDKLRLAVSRITFHDQKTSLRNVLYDEIRELVNDGETDYSRIVIVSDGTDDSRLGMTYQELLELVEAENGCCPIYTIGCFYECSQDILDQLFALSRITGSPYFSMDDYETAEEAAEIADEIRADGDDITYFRFSLPSELKDGSQKGVGLIVHTASNDYTIERSMIMPRGTAKEMKEFNDKLRAEREEAEKKRLEEEEARKKAEEEGRKAEEAEEAEEEPVPQTPLDRFLDNKYVQLLLMPCILALLMLYLHFKDRRKSDVPFQEVTRPAAGHKETPKEQAPDEQEQDDGVLTLFDPERPGEIYRIQNGQELVIGRSAARSDVAFPDDPLLAARHALIRMDQGRAVLDSLGHNDSTSVQDKPVEHTAELFDGDMICVGSIKLRVRYE